MKLVVATPLYPPDPGGPATYAKILEDALPARGIEVEVVKFGEVRALPKLRRHIAYMKLVYRAAKRADAVLALDPAPVGFPSMLAARFAGKKFFVKIVGDYAWEQGTQRYGVTESLDDFVRMPQHSAAVRRLQRVERRVAMHAARVIVPSEYLKKIVTAWGVPERKIVVVYNTALAVPAADAAMKNGEGDGMKSDGARPEGAPAMPAHYVMTVARLVPWKGIADAIRAMTILKMRPNMAALKYIVVGDGPERAALASLARDLGLADAVVFTGALPHDAALSYLAHADAFILPTRYEGLSHTILESFGAGVPVITTDVGGNPELVEDGKTGLMVGIDDAEGIANAIARLADDPELRDRIVRAAREKVAFFSEDRMIDGTIAALAL